MGAGPDGNAGFGTDATWSGAPHTPQNRATAGFADAHRGQLTDAVAF
jgi:hypothetical protein